MLKSIAERKKICIFVRSIRRNNRKIENMIKVTNTINNEVTVFETMEMVNNHIKSEIEWFNSPNENKNGNGYDSDDFLVSEMQYVIFDNSATENAYVCEDGKNTECAEDAWVFETEEEAQSVVDNTSYWWEWATVQSF